MPCRTTARLANYAPKRARYARFTDLHTSITTFVLGLEQQINAQLGSGSSERSPTRGRGLRLWGAAMLKRRVGTVYFMLPSMRAAMADTGSGV